MLGIDFKPKTPGFKLENDPGNGDEPQPEIHPAESPHIDLPQPDHPQAPIQTPEHPVPVKGKSIY